MIKVSITDDHPMVLSGLRQMLESAEGMELEGIYTNGTDLLEGLGKSIPDVLLLDLHLPDISGEELMKTVFKQYPSLKILIFTSIDASFQVKRLLKAGATGYVLKNVDQDILCEAIQKTYQGITFLDPNLKEKLLEETLQGKKAQSNHDVIPSITPREKDILTYLAEGLTSKEIAEHLFLSVRTIDNHRKNLLHKFKTKNTLSMVRMAMDMKIIL